MNTKDLS